MKVFERTKLNYGFDALEPHIDAKTMEIHSEKHHQGYADKFNAAQESIEHNYETPEEILMNLSSLPEDKQTALRNNGGGLVNHNLFFSTLSPNGGGEPTGKVAEFIEELGGMENFKEDFENTATSVFGSGWAMLAVDGEGKNPHLHGFPNQDNPYLEGHLPVFGVDVWEHAYYLKYQNKRAEYVESFWNVLDWNLVNEVFEQTLIKFGK